MSIQPEERSLSALRAAMGDDAEDAVPVDDEPARPLGIIATGLALAAAFFLSAMPAPEEPLPLEDITEDFDPLSDFDPIEEKPVGPFRILATGLALAATFTLSAMPVAASPILIMTAILQNMEPDIRASKLDFPAQVAMLEMTYKIKNSPFAPGDSGVLGTLGCVHGSGSSLPIAASGVAPPQLGQNRRTGDSTRYCALCP